MTLAILIPFREEGPLRPRQRALLWLMARLRHELPDAHVYVSGDDDGLEPFSKTVAINRAFAQSTEGVARSAPDIIGVMDADVWLDPAVVLEANRHIEEGAPWVIPASCCLRLAKAYSEKMLAGPSTAPWPAPTVGNRHEVIRSDPVVGGLHLMKRSAFEDIGGYDPRFRGHGLEDHAAAWALDTMVGKHVTLPGTLYHLWHPEDRVAGERVWPGQEGNNQALARRYADALGHPTKMRVLVDEVRTMRCPPGLASHNG